MHHLPHPPQTAAGHTHERSGRPRLLNTILARLHDTELWANYLPRVPRRLYLLALAGAGLVAAALVMLRRGQGVPGGLALGLGVLLVVPLLGAGWFVYWRGGQRARLRRQVLDSIPWRGDEAVLDVGCGNGLLLNGAARRLKTGRAIGIDLWVPHGGGGTAALLWKNARLENVADRIEFKEADARQMPFDSETFDVVLSSGAMHHISRTHADFDRAMHEMVRVLKPGGRIVIWDMAHMVEACASRMRSAGIPCEVKAAGRLLHLEMGMVSGHKAG